jgi:hypothetical protein
MVRHVLEVGPGHDLQETAIDRRRNTRRCVRVGRRLCAGQMDPIEICPMPQDLLELLERVPTFRSTRLVGSQVATDDVRTNIWA